MTPTLEFLERNPGMLAEMVADFQQRKKIVDMAKTREPIDANVVDNPNLRAFIPYPRLMYNHKLHTTLEVHREEDHQAALANGWKDQPWPNVDANAPTELSPAAEIDEERMLSLENRMLSLEQMVGEIRELILERRKPGRPPQHREE